MFIARVRTMDSKSVDPVLKNAVCKSIFTVEGKNTLNRISPGFRDVYEEPIVRYRNHLKPTFPGSRLVGRDIPLHRGRRTTKFDRSHPRLQPNRRVAPARETGPVALHPSRRTFPVTVFLI